MRVPFTATLQIGPDRWLAFSDPRLVLQADDVGAVRRTLVDVEQLTRDRGLHAVGFVTYEAAGAFGLPVPTAQRGLPLVWFALFDSAHVTALDAPPPGDGYAVDGIEPALDRAGFRAAFARIREHLAAGDSYQANFTFALRAGFSGDPRSLFADLARAQGGAYSAYIDLGETVICSASPELFFEFVGTDIVSRPMKGTAARGRTTAEDRMVAAALAASEKERAENVMIVDMVRNDIGRVADTGSVGVPELFRVERFPHVWQMTSTVRGRTAAPLDDVVAAIHPCASVTGAPKYRTMALLAELEAGPRGVYTGAVGYIPPTGLARFNVAIRTAVIDRAAGRLTFGVGSGIVWDSDADAEYDECLLKGAVLGRRSPDFELLETLLWTPQSGYHLLEAHIGRLTDSADYFGVPLRTTDIRNVLAATVDGAVSARRVRLLVDRAGVPRAEWRDHAPWPEPVRVALAQEAVDSSDVFLHHKTTCRGVYEQAKLGAPGVDDVLLWNLRGELTETTLANVVVELDGRRVTPPVSSGLLAGTCRAALLAAGEVVEGVVMRGDLRRATGLWLVNSVQGWKRAEVVEA